MRPHLAMLSVIASLALLAGCDDPCRPRIVQVLPELGIVRVSNDCAAAVDLGPVNLCWGEQAYTAGCVSIDPGKAVGAGECVDLEVKMPAAPATAFGLALFHVQQNKLTDAPIDAAIWGPQNKGLRNEHGIVVQPALYSVPAGRALTRGEGGLYLIDAAAPTSCATWGHLITVDKLICEPKIVEVHPGQAPYFKVSMPAGCSPVDLAGASITWGSPVLPHKTKLPGVELGGGDCIVVGDGVSNAHNGWAQWPWDHLEPLPVSKIGPVPSGHTGVAVASLSWGGKVNSGVVYGSASGPLPKIIGLGSFIGQVPADMSLRWTGSAWTIAPTAANQCPRWDVQPEV